MKTRLLLKAFSLALSSVVLASLLGLNDISAQGLFRLTEKQEIELGRRAAAEIEKEQPVLRDLTSERYISRLGQALVRRSGRAGIKYQFKIINSADINAFALPGGFIYVNRGLIEAADNESELAGVLGHEIAHVAARHHVDQIRRAQVAGLGAGALGRLLGRGAGATIGRTAAQMVATGAFLKFSRDAEREADRLGAKNLYDAGYDPRGMLTFFEKLSELGKRQPNKVETFFSTHPGPAERADNISDLIATFPAKGNLRVNSPDFQNIERRLSRLSPPADQPRKTVSPVAAPVEMLETVAEDGYKGEAKDYEIASIFAPIFYQGLGDRPRYDYITNFDFDRDWRGDNNWNNAGNPLFPLKAYIYYAVSETATHYFIHYAAFHPRDYKGGKRRGVILSDLIREGVRRGGQYDPTGRADEAVLAHENDLEGCLVVAEKNGDDPRQARVAFVETLAHNKFYKLLPEAMLREGFEAVKLEGRRAKLFVEPRGHGIVAYTGSPEQTSGSENGLLIYTYTGNADNPEKQAKGAAGYKLVPIYSTMWPRAKSGENEMYGIAHDYGAITLSVVESDGRVAERSIQIGSIGSSFRGRIGGRDMARPPWGWFDGSERDRPLGEWFFNPAETIKRHFNLGDQFSVSFLHHPVFGILRP